MAKSWAPYAQSSLTTLEEGEEAGTVLGTAGVSGNLDDAIQQGYAMQHVHIEMRIGGWDEEDG